MSSASYVTQCFTDLKIGDKFNYTALYDEGCRCLFEKTKVQYKKWPINFTTIYKCPCDGGWKVGDGWFEQAAVVAIFPLTSALNRLDTEQET